ncbi:MAG TPA: DUF4331 domain-containing protein [Jatrophihabitantaceae bacterium]|jgi:hypothetical protein
MSSHREAPEISKDPAADNTDTYVFVSPDHPDTVTIIANFIPLQKPDGGPNFYEFADDVTYRIHISNGGKSQADITYAFDFTTQVRSDKTFLYNTGPITSIHDTTWNRPQFYTVTRWENGKHHVLGKHLAVPPVNIGFRSTPNYAETFTAAATHKVGHLRHVFAGQRAEGFFVDLGSIFDLGALRPFQHLHLIPSADAVGVNGGQGLNVHTIAMQVPITDLTHNGVTPKGINDPHAVIGVWATSSRRKSRVFDGKTKTWKSTGPWVQVSRLGNPLFNEVIVPMARKDEWNFDSPHNDKEYAKFVLHPELAGLLPVLYPGVFPHLKSYKKPRIDLAAVLLTGVPKGIIAGFQNFTGAVEADMLRLNVMIPPKKEADANNLGVLGGDLAGFPNGRRVFDNIVAAELRAVAGATIPLVDPDFTPDDAASALTDGTTNTNAPYLKHFPYLGTPAGGYETTPGTPGGNT